ncbi:MAG TPA: T9SS type A sorting domain-containing protein [Lentimicrobium sp.]|nr:T9SS type A sorting domain-containing protein [Lentimicrobium sp.]
MNRISGIVISLSLSMLLVMGFKSQAQVVLEHTFTSNACNVTPFVTTNGIQYLSYDKNTHAVTIYNTDYSVYKSVTIEYVPDHSPSFMCASDKLFNTDSKIEFIAVVGDGFTNNSMKLYNEDGAVIKNFGNKYYAHTISAYGITKLRVYNFTYDANYNPILYTDEIYSVPGSASVEINDIGFPELTPFPNPTNQTITLPYKLEPNQHSEMNIYNLNGQLLDKKHIGSNFDKIMLNVEGYQPGIYIYEYNGISNRFVVSK